MHIYILIFKQNIKSNSLKSMDFQYSFIKISIEFKLCHLNKRYKINVYNK